MTVDDLVYRAVVTHRWNSAVSGRERYYTKFIGPYYKEAMVCEEALAYAIQAFASKDATVTVVIQVSSVDWKVVPDGQADG